MDLLSQMTTFTRIVEAGSLSGAARALGVSLPAVSRQLRALEDELGAPLIRRTTRRMALTDRGQTLYDRAVVILDQVEETRSIVAPSPAVRGTLVVSAPITIALSFVVPRLAAFISRYPGVEIDLRLEDHLVDFVREGVDVAVRGGAAPPDSTSYVARPVARFRRIVVGSTSYVRKNGSPTAPANLRQHHCLSQRTAAGVQSTWTLEHVSRRGASQRIAVRGPVRATAPMALAELAELGVGLALLPHWLVEKSLAEGRLVRLLAKWHSPEVVTWAIHRADQRRSALIGAFIAALGGERSRPGD